MLSLGMRTTKDDRAKLHGRPRIAYLVNQYPLGSHTFIRREIAALEQLGFDVVRVSIRDTSHGLVDPDDVDEARRTAVLLPRTLQEVRSLAGSLLRCTQQSPAQLFGALKAGLQLGWRARRGLLPALASVAEAAQLLQLLRARSITHVHAHFGTNPATVALLTQALGGPGFSFTAHGPEEFDRPESLSLSDKIGRARFVVGVSAFGRSQLLRHTPSTSWSKVKVVPCGVDGPYVRPARRTRIPSARRLVCVGRLDEQKGQLVLVEAAALLASRGVRFRIVLVGDGELRGQIEDAVRARKLQRHIKLAGWCDGARVRAEIRAARALVLPSFAEGLPVVLMEALALGRPVISTWVAGIPELVAPGACGWLVPPSDAGALAAAMLEALRAPPRVLERMGSEGRRRVLARHDARRSAELLAEHFRTALTNTPARPR